MPKSNASMVSSVLLALPDPLRSELFQAAVAHHLREGEALFSAGDVGDGCYRLEKGLVKIVVSSQQGEEHIISLLGPGAIVGELSIIRRRAALRLGGCHCRLFIVVRKPGQISEVHRSAS